jgi:hypothetical protein
MEDDFRHFMLQLTEAGARMKGHFFRLPQAGSGDFVLYERLYRYELYHQLRIALGDSYPYMLDGGFGAEGRPHAPGVQKPDFRVHVPDKPNRNLVALGIKPAIAEKKDLKIDITSLDKCISGSSRYYRGVLLIYGDGKQNSTINSIREAKKLIRRFNDRILLAWHGGPGERPRLLIGSA